MAEVAGRSSLVAALVLPSHEISHHHSPVQRARLLEVEEEEEEEVVVVVETAVVAVDAVGSLGEDDLEKSLTKINASVCPSYLEFGEGTCTSTIQNILNLFVYDQSVHDF